MNVLFHSESPSSPSSHTVPSGGCAFSADISPSHLNSQLTLPSFRNFSFSTVQHHVYLNDSSSSRLPNSLNHNGAFTTSSLIEYDLLNPNSRSTVVSDPIFHHGTYYRHIHNSQLSPENHQYLSLPQPDTLRNFRSSSPQLDFTHIRSDYLTMISPTNSANPTSTEVEDQQLPVSSSNASLLTPLPDDEVAAQAGMDALEDSPEYKMENEFSAYLTSPLDDSPWEEDMLTTPSFGSAADLRVDILTSPALIDSSDTFADLPLFPDVPLFDLTFDKLNAHNAAQPLFPAESDIIYAVDSSHSSSRDSPSLRSSPLSPVGHDVLTNPLVPATVAKARSVSANAKSNRRKSAPTGTRKNLTPESLVPMEAPIQPRKYVTSSATSRKELPAVFARKRKRSMGFTAEKDEEDQLVVDPSAIPPTPFELDAIEAKRRQNTLAARRSRKRKLEHQQELENAIDKERREKEAWKARALALEALLRNHQIKIPLELEEGGR